MAKLTGQGFTRKSVRPMVLKHFPEVKTLDGEMVTGELIRFAFSHNRGIQSNNCITEAIRKFIPPRRNLRFEKSILSFIIIQLK